MKLNLGCGKDIREGWINIDRHEYPGVVQYDISRLPLPFADGVVDEILASHVLEHLIFWEELMPEFNRILRPGGILEIRVPFGLSPQPWHYRTFDLKTLNHYTDESLYHESTSLDSKRPDWILLECRTSRRNLLEWHQRKYLGRMVLRLPLGSRWEIIWRLEKPPKRFSNTKAIPSG
jgi:SAM-dependent methyltransferase